MKNKTTYLIKSIALFSVGLAIFGLNACSTLLGSMGGDQPPPIDYSYPGEEDNTPVSFTILQMNDVYEIAPLEKGKVGGMARVATFRNQLLEENFNLMTVLAGDFLSPSLLGTMKYEGKSIKGRQMVEVMNSVGVGLVAFGNHEFDVKEGELQERMNESYFDWLGTNVLHQTGKKIEPFYKESYDYKYFAPDTYVWEIENYNGKPIRVGFYSACLSDNQQPWVYYEDPYQEATKAYLELVQNCDVIIGLTHLELAQDMKMAALLPKTKLIMGGHEHENSLDSIGNVVIAKADANAKSVWVHRFTYYPDVKTTELYSELVQITDAIPSDPEVDEIVQRWQEVLTQEIKQVVNDPDEVIYKAKTPLDGREKSVRNFQTNLGGIIAAGMAASAKKPVDAAFFNGGSIRLDDQLSGDITAVDVFRALPFGGGLYEVELKGTILKKALDAGMENQGLGGYLQWYNIEYDVVSKSWEVAGKPLNTSKIYRIVVSQYVFEGKENRLDFFNQKNFVSWQTAKEGDSADLRSDIRKAVIADMRLNAK
ncbi:MAG: bifunctional metallophosphatase/5'-nucleotidase [Saprospiraceae bacterium]|nr:bifunctional metallophosphatase/5'-nucleotidase [Saprospiraceae bacterium]MCF8248902.1 bifunctional metallophosphatase/5'-nucleotidase [Saprospiraceae bacterium]MCF8279627.1 bifunctional metallophosphatase/5'-nucleotidase [Bacteroidales bacterium]MCF8310187.1 bifunctional metallophosphatase/5'-nucleotidase [Saprospiraceae bacterium]MCF8439087.1 bifunctional metallophosphatase/5'-nucleotidase [Saprospiraceae bacterium]